MNQKALLRCQQKSINGGTGGVMDGVPALLQGLNGRPLTGEDDEGVFYDELISYPPQFRAPNHPPAYEVRSRHKSNHRHASALRVGGRLYIFRAIPVFSVDPVCFRLFFFLSGGKRLTSSWRVARTFTHRPVLTNGAVWGPLSASLVVCQSGKISPTQPFHPFKFTHTHTHITHTHRDLKLNLDVYWLAGFVNKGRHLFSSL